jgi:hypothetical protein
VTIARFQMSPEFLRELLHLPRGTAIVRAGMDRDNIELTIAHPDLRNVSLADEEQPPLIQPTFRREADVVLLVDWGQKP